MKIIKHVIWLVPVLLMIVYSCKKEVYDTTPSTNDPACDSITYIKHAKPIFDAKCISCHVAGGTGPGDYTILANIQRDKDAIKRVSVTNSSMPKGGPALTTEEKYLLGKWIDCGASGTEAAADPACDTLLYEKQMKPFFDKNCTSCHDGSGTGPGDFTKLSVIKQQKDRINIRVSNGTMPPSGAVSDQEKLLLSKWIECGTKGSEVYNGPVFTNDVDSIFIKHCTSCHSPSGTEPTDYNKYDVVKSSIESKDLEKRVFVIQDMPPSDTLSKAERVKLKEWLDAGYPKE